MNVKALKKQLKEMGLPTDGKKSDLEFRLAGALKYDETCEACGEEPCACVDEDAIEDEVIEEVAEEEIAEEIAEEEAPVEEEIVEEKPEEPNMDGGPDCQCSWCVQGWSHR
tara:strand:+ start:1197 stop:1529 length:333 start_codon:yes stop_codon:yes gene_type:complete